MDEKIDLTTALKKLHRLQLEGGDLDGAYWLEVYRLLKYAGEYRDRALVAEEKLRRIRQLCE